MSKKRWRSFLRCVVLGCGLLGLAACTAPPAGQAAKAAGAPPEDAAAKSAQVQAQRLLEAMTQAPAAERAPGQTEPAPAPAREVVWLEPRPPAPPDAQELGPAAVAAAAAAPVTIAANDAASVMTVAAPLDPPPAQVPALRDRETLLRELLAQIRRSDSPALNKALRAAALAAASDRAELDPRDLAALDESRRELVSRYHQLILSVSRQLAGESQVDRAALVAQLDRLTDQSSTIRILRAALCRSVSGYGVYEPFDGYSFLAGREQPMIVYLELDEFHSVRTGGDRYQVKLAQEMVIYNESDGLAVWRQPSTEIRDESRNKRRDFFVVQLVKVPARLTVGKYLLKVRITDLQGGTIDETTMPFQVVADQALVVSERKR